MERNVPRSSLPFLRASLIGVELLMALNAAGGGIYGLNGARDIPREWLSGSPFPDYFVPSLFLLVVVGGSMLIAALLVLLRPCRGARASLLAGVVLMLWIIVQVAIIGPVSLLQPACFVAGLLISGLALLLRRRLG
jgi:hypothetical protein